MTAQPGAGKTTRIPPYLVDDGAVILLQPRRVAARAIARRIAAERGWSIGREIGWHVRMERRFSAATRLLVATEGILTARLQQDPLLSDFRTIVLDEFHERSIHADLAIALAKQAWLARSDLRIVVMSATLDAGAVSRFLGGCPTIAVAGTLHPLTVEHAPGASVAAAAAALLDRTPGDVLCFLPGAHEIRRTIAELSDRIRVPVDVLPLYGALPAEEQDRALRKTSAGRRIVVATNVAETSVTVPGVTAVVDSGLQKVSRYDVHRAIDLLETERITQDSADQRAGRAARTAPGITVRLWDHRDRLRPHREPDVHRIDLAAPVLDVLAWGGDPASFDWFDPPRPEAIRAALDLLGRLGAVRHGQLTDVGRAMNRLPIPPRLARMLIAAGFAAEMVQACAVLADRRVVARRRTAAATRSDLLSSVDEWTRMPDHIHATARSIEHAIDSATFSRSAGPLDEEAFCRAVLAGYPDRVGQRRAGNSQRVKLANGAGAVLSDESGVTGGEFLVAVDLQGVDRTNRAAAEQRIRMASAVERGWLEPDRHAVVHRLDAAQETVSALDVEYYGTLVLTEREVAVDAEIAAAILAQQWLSRNISHDDRHLLRRLRFAGLAADPETLVRTAAFGQRRVRDIRLSDALGSDALPRLEREAPATVVVPSGRQVRLDYLEDGSVRADVKLQELFGLADTPVIGIRREPLLLGLLAPNGRPVQLTRDLRSFWSRTYPEVRKELRGRYPKHPWPEDPWNAAPTARTIRRQKISS